MTYSFQDGDLCTVDKWKSILELWTTRQKAPQKKQKELTHNQYMQHFKK